MRDGGGRREMSSTRSRSQAGRPPRICPGPAGDDGDSLSADVAASGNGSCQAVSAESPARPRPRPGRSWRFSRPLDRGEGDGDAGVRGLGTVGDLRPRCGPVPLLEPGDAGGQELPGFRQLVPPPSGANAQPHRTRAPPTMNANSRPRSAATTSERVSRVLPGTSFRPVHQAPTRTAAPSSHQQAVQTGLHSPIRVTSQTRSYSASGEHAITIDSE